MFKKLGLRYLTGKSGLTKAKVQLDQCLIETLEKENLKPKQHPGIIANKCVALPDVIRKGIIRALGDHPTKSLCTDGATLNRYLNARHHPPEVDNVKIKHREIRKKIEDELGVASETLNEIESTQIQQTLDAKVYHALNQNIYRWQSIVYDSYKSLQYLVGRSAQEYAVLFKIFTEISQRNNNFQPRSFFDFGSGVGSGLWATSNVWKDKIYEYYLVDSAREMNDLADLILREGYENKNIKQRKVYFRQFLPAFSSKYDIVLSAYSLFELPSANARQEILINLWNKCDNYLVIVEQGTKAGFTLVNEAKELILKHSIKNNEDVHVFSPCPHEISCPRIKLNDGTPCNFIVSYKTLAFEGSPEIRKELYSYVVLKKGKRNEFNESESWPRLVRPTLVRARHTICRMCNKNGELQEVIFTASKQGKITYKCARASNWGDRLPITMEDSILEK